MHGHLMPRRLPSMLAHRRRGYTLIEILVATTLTLMLMGAVVQIFGFIGESVSDSRSTLELSDRLRATAARLQKDLAGVTVTMRPPRRPEADEGYFEYTEGPIGPIILPGVIAKNTDENPVSPPPDTTVGDFDDMLMFTTRSTERPFVGKCSLTVDGTIESHVAEVAWFVRGTTLYRRILMVAPSVVVATLPTTIGFYAENDISVRLENGQLRANTLGDLTKRENRYAHQSPKDNSPLDPPNRSGHFPFHPHVSVNTSTHLVSSTPWAMLGLPTLRECSYVDTGGSYSWNAGAALPLLPNPAQAGAQKVLTPNGQFDAWVNPHPWQELDPATGTFMLFFDANSPRVAEDVILTNVIGFDVRAWDPRARVLLDNNGTPAIETDDVVLAPGDEQYEPALRAFLLGSGSNYSVVSFGAYVDLNYASEFGAMNAPSLASLSMFAGPGDPRSRLSRSQDPPNLLRFAGVYDTWSFHYEHDGIDQDEAIDGGAGRDQGTNGFDDDDDGVVDDPGEMETSPPYPVPLRGIQVKLRVFEPDSRQIREVTVVQDFLPK